MKKQPKIQVFSLPQFKYPFVVIELRNRTYCGFYFEPEIHLWESIETNVMGRKLKFHGRENNYD